MKSSEPQFTYCSFVLKGGKNRRGGTLCPVFRSKYRHQRIVRSLSDVSIYSQLRQAGGRRSPFLSRYLQREEVKCFSKNTVERFKNLTFVQMAIIIKCLMFIRFFPCVRNCAVCITYTITSKKQNIRLILMGLLVYDLISSHTTPTRWENQSHFIRKLMFRGSTSDLNAQGLAACRSSILSQGPSLVRDLHDLAESGTTETQSGRTTENTTRSISSEPLIL